MTYRTLATLDAGGKMPATQLPDAAATDAEVATLLTSYGRSRGNGLAWPTTDLRRGDVFQHSALGLGVYTGSGWRLVGPAQLPNAAARVALSTNLASELYTGLPVVETDTGYERRWNGTGWVKSGGAPELLTSTASYGASGAVAPTALTAVRSLAIPALTVGGRVRGIATGCCASGAAASAYWNLRIGSTDLAESKMRTSNNGVAGAPAFHVCEGSLYCAPGAAATTLYLMVAVDSGSASTYAIDGSFRVYLDPGWAG